MGAPEAIAKAGSAGARRPREWKCTDHPDRSAAVSHAGRQGFAPYRGGSECVMRPTAR